MGESCWQVVSVGKILAGGVMDSLSGLQHYSLYVVSMLSLVCCTLLVQSTTAHDMVYTVAAMTIAADTFLPSAQQLL